MHHNKTESFNRKNASGSVEKIACILLRYATVRICGLGIMEANTNEVKLVELENALCLIFVISAMIIRAAWTERDL